MELFEIVDFLVPVVLGFYGFRWLMNPPEFGSPKGLATKYSKISEESWLLAHKFGGKLSIIYGAVMLALAIAKRFITNQALFSIAVGVFLVIELALIFSLIPVINIYIKKKSR